MVTIKDKIDAIKALPDYVSGSLILKSANIEGAVYKYLINVSGVANRKEVFYELDSSEIGVNFESKTVVSEIEVIPAH